MSPAIATSLGIRAWPWRLSALGVSVLAVLAVAVSMSLSAIWPTQLAFTLVGPVVGLSWSVLCVASWFHPEHGSLSPNARFVGKLPVWLQSALRWYASLFLLLFVLFCLVAWPMFSLSSLWHLVK
jgi:hypothetical protein